MRCMCGAHSSPGGASRRLMLALSRSSLRGSCVCSFGAEVLVVMLWRSFVTWWLALICRCAFSKVAGSATLGWYGGAVV
jgi:hypothetical protein